MTLREAAEKDPDAVLAALNVTPLGLSTTDVSERRVRFGPNSLGQRTVRVSTVLASQIRNPLLILLGITAIVSSLLGERADAYIILGIVGLSVGLGFFNEYRSARAMADLMRRVRHSANVLRDGKEASCDVAALVPGDVVRIGIGDVVPADLRLIRSDALECDEAVLTGESGPVAKDPQSVSTGVLSELRCCALMGTTVKAGMGTGVVVATGRATAFGRIAAKLAQHPPETAFQLGLRRFSGLLVRVTAVLTVSIFVVNAALHHPLLDSLLFSLAIAVGLTPQLLPAIVTVSLATGAERLAKKCVVVKRLVSIEDLGNVEVLFTDKTGTLTEGVVAFHRALDSAGRESAGVFRLGLACSGAVSALDAALQDEATKRNIQSGFTIVSTAPFDYERKRMSVLARDAAGRRRIVVKGSPESIFAACADVSAAAREVADRLFRAGERVVAVATRACESGTVTAADERDLVLLGFLTFADPVKRDAAESIERLRRLGIDVKIVTGDNGLVAAKVCSELGISITGMLEGSSIDALDDAELSHRIATTTVFARVTPEQKSRIITLQRRLGSDVGFLGDGVNDAIALHDSDVGISVDSATDVAKDAADIILLQKDLAILADGVVEGRRIFANTIKYVLMGTSSNFGNMFSAAGASLFLPFLPMTAPQILLNNLLYDAGEMTIPTDNVDDDQLFRPARWDIAFVRRFMLIFGPISSIFDFMTFGMMLWVFQASAALFQSGWFVESLLTQTLIIFAIRTKRVPFFRSRPSWPLTLTSLAIVGIGMALPYTGAGRLFGFVPLPPAFFAILIGMIACYLLLVEAGKWYFFGPRRTHPADAERLTRRRRLQRLASRWMHVPGIGA